GRGQVVLLSGEGGIGKSRLAQVLKEQVAAEPQAWLTPCQCSPYYQHTALYPMIDLLERVVLQFEREETPPQKVSKLEGFLVQYGLPLAEALPLFATLLSLPLAADYAPLTVSPEQQKQQILHTLLAILLRIAAQQPVLFVMEDLHWVDPTTLELLRIWSRTTSRIAEAVVSFLRRRFWSKEYGMDGYAAEVEQKMQRFFGWLSEKDRRRYAAVEAAKLGHGGVEYIARVLACDPKTIRQGLRELEEAEDAAVGRLPKKRGGRRARRGRPAGFGEDPRQFVAGVHRGGSDARRGTVDQPVIARVIATPGSDGHPGRSSPHPTVVGEAAYRLPPGAEEKTM